MKTKTRTTPAGQVVSHYEKSGGYKSSVTTLNGQTETITYGEGPKSWNGKLIWKPCSHVKNGVITEWADVSFTFNPYEWYYQSSSGFWRGIADNSAPPIDPPSSVPLQELYDKWMDQIDLNTRDSALLYSNIVQLVPLLGPALRVGSVLRSVARRLSKEMRRRPFTTAIRYAIQADFVSRFVIQPTLADARMVANATNYVVNVVNTAYQRSAQATTPFRVDIDNSTLKTSSHGAATNGFRVEYDDEGWSTAKFSLFSLAQVVYDTQAIDPIKLWMARTGVTRPLDSAWDLIPFSFVADYFFRTGEFIQGLSDKMSDQEGLRGKLVSISDQWLTSKVGRTRILRPTGISRLPSQPGKTTTVVAGQTRMEWVSFDRRPINMQEFSKSGFWDKGGLYDPHLSSTRKRTLAELFIQAKLR